MASRNKIIKIVTDPEKFQERVDEITGEVSYETVKHVIASIKRALYDHPDTPALCAPQIGENLRLFVVRNSKKESNRFTVFLNPLTVSSEGLHLSREKNLSFGESEFIIPRKDKMHVAYQTEDGHVDSQTFIGAYAEVVQQMIEMLDGLTIADYGLNLDDIGGSEVFDSASDTERAELLGYYLESLKINSDEINKQIEEDPLLNAISKEIKFETEVLKGNIKPVDKDGNIIDDDYIKAHAKEIAKKKVAELTKNSEEK